MPLPGIEQVGVLFVRAVQAFVKQVEEIVQYIIDKVKEKFGGLI
jgi:hypothetical protein